MLIVQLKVSVIVYNYVVNISPSQTEPHRTHKSRGKQWQQLEQQERETTSGLKGGFVANVSFGSFKRIVKLINILDFLIRVCLSQQKTEIII